MEHVDPELVQEVLHEWQETERAAVSLAHGGVDYARRILEKAFGSQKAGSILKRIESQLHDEISLSHLRNADPAQLTAVIRNEHPQIIALILAYLDAAQTAAILREIDPEAGSEILYRMARMEKVMPEALKVLESTLGVDSDLSSLLGESSAAGGPETVAEVMNLTTSALEKELLDGLAGHDPELAQQVKDLMFTFQDIVNLDDAAVTRILRDVDTKQLALALKVASNELRDRMLGTLSSRARDALMEEMEFLGPVRVSDVERAQSEVVRTARALEEAGEIVIGAAEDLVVE
jgi:flagellar motor switch protein FliG